MTLSLVLLAHGFMSSDVNADPRETAKSDVQKCQEEAYKNKDSKELISIFDQNAIKHSKNNHTEDYFEEVKKEINRVFDSLKAYPRPANPRYNPNQKKPEEITKECYYAANKAKRRYDDYLKEVFQGNKALIKIFSKEPRPIPNNPHKRFPNDQIADWYKFTYVHVDEKLTEIPYRELRILKSTNPAPEFKAGDILIIKNFETEYAMIVRPQDIKKVESYNPS